MSPATVGEVMTRDVIAVEAHTPFQEVVDLLAADHVSAVPVLEDGRVVGVLSEADLLGEIDLDGSQADRPVARTAGEVAAEVMTGPAVTVGPQSSLLAAARLMSARRIKRLPVVDENGRLVGILSRRDLLRTAARRDAEVREELLAGRGEDEEQIERYEQLGIQPWADAVERPVWVRVRAEEISGREIHR